MMTGLFTAAGAMNAFQTSLDTTSNNLANVNTTAFKGSTVSFEDLVYSGAPNSQVGNGVRVSSVAPLGFAQGSLVGTGRSLDVAINGTGFLTVQLPDGTMQYTRDGSLNVDSSGRLVTSAGYLVQPPITIPPGTASTVISPTGTVTVTPSAPPNTPKVIGTLQLASFVNQEGLTIEPGNLYSQSVSSGPPTIGVPGSAGLGTLQQGSLENSNVDVTTELTNMVTAQQAYTASSKVINTTNQMVGSALALVQ